MKDSDRAVVVDALDFAITSRVEGAWDCFTTNEPSRERRDDRHLSLEEAYILSSFQQKLLDGVLLATLGTPVPAFAEPKATVPPFDPEEGVNNKEET